MGEADITFRHLLRKLPRPLLRLAFPRRKLELVGPFDASVDRTRRLTTDNLFRVRDRTGDVAVHVEIERGWRADIPPRIFDYAAAAIAGTGLPVWSVVVLLRPGGGPPRGTGVYRIPGVDGDAFVFRYQVVPLWELDARQIRAELGVEAAPFCVAMQGSDEAFVRTLAEEVKNAVSLPKHRRQSTMQLLYVVSVVILGADTAKRIFHMESIIQDPGIQALIREWQGKAAVEGHARGRAKGRAEGRAEALAEGAAKARVLLQKVLASRSLAVTSDARARIERESDISRLEAWIEAALNARSMREVFRAR